MMVDKTTGQSSLYRAATTAFDFNNAPESLAKLLRLATEMLHAESAALYEFDEANSGFMPRFAQGVSVSELGRISATSDNAVLRAVLSNHHAAVTQDSRQSLGLPLGPGIVACAPCLAATQTIGLIFTGTPNGDGFSEGDLATLEVLAARAAEVLAFARQTAAQNYLFHKLTLLYQASHAINATRDRQEAIRQTAAHLLSATSADACDVHVFHEGSGQTTRFRQQMGKGAQQNVVAVVLETLPDYQVHREVLQNRQPATLCITPPVGAAKDIALLQSEEFSSAAIFPLATRNNALGFVRVLYALPNRQISDQEMELAQAIINIGAVGLQDAMHLETAEARANQLQVLGEIGREMTSTLELEAALENAMKHAQGLLQAEACVLFLLDERHEKLVVKASGGSQPRIRDVTIRLEEGIAGWVTRNRRPLIVNDVRSNPLYHSAIDGQTGLLTTSVLCVPLETRGETLGVIEAINHPPGAFNESDQRVLENVASWAGIAVDNANLFRRVAEERSRLETTLVETADAVVLTA